MSRQYQISTFVMLDRFGSLFPESEGEVCKRKAGEIKDRIKELLTGMGYSHNDYCIEVKEDK